MADELLFKPEEKTQIIEHKIEDVYPVTAQYTKAIDLRSFIKEFANLLLEKNFEDMIGPHKKDGKYFGKGAKSMEFIDGKNNRTPNMYEQKFVKINQPRGKAFEYEILWFARKKVSDYGWFEFKMDFSIRGGKDIEILEGNSKKVLQSGKWELRCTFTYKNSIFRDYLNKIPIVKNSEFLKRMYINHIYKKQITTDIDICKEKLMGETIIKHFNKYLS
ncbi:MAG: hypothetical protein ACOCXG_00060 [Nanoarchaeota archaeon]